MFDGQTSWVGGTETGFLVVGNQLTAVESETVTGIRLAWWTMAPRKRGTRCGIILLSVISIVLERTMLSVRISRDAFKHERKKHENMNFYDYCAYTERERYRWPVHPDW